MNLIILALPLLAAATTVAQDTPVKIVTLGDSITRGVRPGVKPDETFAQQLQKMLAKDDIKADVVNVGIGGERTDQALKRLDAVIKLKPKIVTIMYGTNDSYVDKGAQDSRPAPPAYRQKLTKIPTDLT